jgi:hypothetical protein
MLLHQARDKIGRARIDGISDTGLTIGAQLSDEEIVQNQQFVQHVECGETDARDG